MNKSMKCIILIFAVIMIMVITGLGFCKGRNQEKITKEKKIEKAENGEKTTKYVNNEVTKDKQTGIYYVKNVIDIFFDESISETEKTEIIDEVQGSIIDSIPSVNQVQIKIPETDYQGLKRTIEIIEEKEGVLAATSDIVVPIDMSSRKEFKAENPKKDYTNKADWYQKIGAESFEQYKTSHINVGVVDVGFDFNHADVDIVDLSKIRSKKKDHGTHVAGIIGAKHNSYGINGVLSNCTLYGYDCLPDENQKPYHTAEIWFVDSNGECQCIKKEENISMNDEVLGGGNLFFNYEKHEYQTSSVSCLYGVKNGQPYELQISGKYMNFRIDENRNKYIAEDPEYNEGQQYEDIFFEYDENIEEFYKITN